MTKRLGHWNLLDDGENEKVWNIDNLSQNIFIVTKISTMKVNDNDDTLKQIERILFGEFKDFTRLAMAIVFILLIC